MRLSKLAFAAVFGLSASVAFGQPPATALSGTNTYAGGTEVSTEGAKGPYKVVKTAKVGGEGGFDYVTADPDSRHLFVVRAGVPGRPHFGL